MAQALGSGLLSGIAKQTTWGTSVNVNTTAKGFRVLDFSFDEQREPLIDMSYNADRIHRQTTNTGNYKCSGSFKVDLKYGGLDTLQALFFGTAGVPTGANPYVHTWYRKVDMTGIFGTLCVYDGLKTHEFEGVKIDKLKYSSKLGGALQLEVNFRARLRSENTATNANLSSLTEHSTIDRVQALLSTVSYQTITQGGTLADLEIAEWSVEFSSPYEDDDRLFTSLTAPYMREPAALDLTTKIDLSTPFEATTYMTGALAGTTYELKFLHTLSASAIFGIWIPSVTWEKVGPTLQDRGGLPLKFSGRGDKAVSAPTGFDQAVPYVKVTNTISTDALA